MELLTQINALKKRFDFKNYDLFAELMKLPKILKGYRDTARTSQNISLLEMETKLLETMKHLESAYRLLQERPLSDYSCILHLDDYYKLRSLYQHLGDLIPLNFKETLPKRVKTKRPGRPKYSLQEFIIFHLIRMYVHGTKKPIKNGWLNPECTGTGETFNFVVNLRPILLMLDSSLKLSSKNKTISSTIDRLKHNHDLMALLSHLNN